ncbi:MAG: GatB/YqeY domain-containing protein [Deltaproteobacteria bacterium]|nr:GatB/YqeY domain-containing protein [Deltaproteobacteria bacterium]
MELLQRIEQSLKEAMRSQDENRRNAVRLLLTAMKVKEKELKRPLGEPEMQQVITGQIKQRRDSAEQFQKGGRQDLAEKELAEIAVLQGFLPEPMQRAELEKLVDEVIAALGAQSPKDMGKVMKDLLPRIAGRADGKEVNELVRQRLQGRLS